MPEQIRLIIALTKNIDSFEQGEAMFAVVKEKLADHPDVQIQGRITKQMEVIITPDT